MRDLSVLLIVVACTRLIFYRPWLGVLVLSVFAYMNPHTYGVEFMPVFPVFKFLFVAVLIALAISFYAKQADIQSPPRDWRLIVFVLLWAYFLFTTTVSLVPSAAWPRFIEVSSIFTSLGLTVILINTREKLTYLIATIALSFGLLALKGGYWAVMTGFTDRVYGPPGTHFWDNNYLAIAVIMNIPLLVLWLKNTPQRVLRYALMLAIGLSGAAALSSWSRGALLALGATLVLLIWDARRKVLALCLLVAGTAVAFSVLPGKWFARMETIQHFETASPTRLWLWDQGIQYAFEHPWTGAGFDGWREVVGRDWHNAFVEVIAEHGFIAFGLWLSLLAGTIFSLTRLAYLADRLPRLAWVRDYSAALRTSLVAYAVGSTFSNLSSWDIWYHLVLISVLLKKFAIDEMSGSAVPGRPAQPGTQIVPATNAARPP